MPLRIHLDIVERPGETIWFTLVIDDPIHFYVEQCFESKKPYHCGTWQIKAEELSRYWVNDKSLIKLVEEKFTELTQRYLDEDTTTFRDFTRFNNNGQQSKAA